MKNELMKNKGNIQKNDEGLNKVNESDVLAEGELKEFEKEEAGVGDPQEIRDRETASLAHHRDLSSAKSRRAAGRRSYANTMEEEPRQPTAEATRRRRCLRCRRCAVVEGRLA